MDYSGKIIKKTPVTPSQTSASGVWTLDDAIQAQKTNTWPVANVPNPISRSLRFRSSASAYLNRTLTSSGSATIFTYSAWIKRGSLTNGPDQWLFGSTNYLTTGSGNPLTFQIIFKGTDSGSDVNKIVVGAENNASSPLVLSTTQLFRDPSAWYHIVVAIDTTQATSSNRAKLYVNGVQVTAFGTATYPSQNTALGVNQSGNTPTIGCMNLNSSPTRFFDGYMTEVNLIDGQALTPSSFGGTNTVTGVWEPRQYTGTYGTNGFYLNFKDNTSTTTLGYDYSGNSNNWTTNNISLTAGSTYDSMLDVPTQWIGYGNAYETTRGNYCTLNPLSVTAGSMTDGNLYFSANTTAFYGAKGTIELPTTGKYYFEARLSTSGTNNSEGGDYTLFGVILTGTNTNNAYDRTTFCAFGDNGWVYNFNSNTNAAGSALSSGDVIAMAIDRTANTYTFYRNNSSVASGTLGVASGTALIPLLYSYGSTIGRMSVNFGQQPFAYTPPSGYLPLCTTNLSSPTILQGNQYFDALTWTGTGTTSNRTITGLNFQPDFVWAKSRSAAYDHCLYDAVRGAGATKELISNNDAAEGGGNQDQYGYLSSFNSDGFSSTVGSLGQNLYFNDTAYPAYVAWNWKASNAAGVTSTAGTITSTVSANTTSGFSIVTYTGTGSAATVGHGLGVAPSMIIVKSRSAAGTFWPVYHASLGATKYLSLNYTDAEATSSAIWNNTSPTSTVFSIATSSNINGNGSTYVAYCFAAVAGYSAFGSYTGNGSSDGPFIYTGFLPRYIMYKRTDTTGNWVVLDTARDTTNANDVYLYPNDSVAEASGAFNTDFLSNGFKLRNTNTTYNASGGTYIYMAFAENPFKNALAR